MRENAYSYLETVEKSRLTSLWWIEIYLVLQVDEKLELASNDGKQISPLIVGKMKKKVMLPDKVNDRVKVNKGEFFHILQLERKVLFYDHC